MITVAMHVQAFLLLHLKTLTFETINTELMTLPDMEVTVRGAALVYIPGGNTFLLNHRLHLSKFMDTLQSKVRAGFPLVAFSAGTILCGPIILTSTDMNLVGTSYFSGLKVTSFNFNVHYAEDEIIRFETDEWLREYHVFHENPVIIMADGAYIRVEGKKTTLVRGEAWILRKGQEKEKLSAGEPIRRCMTQQGQHAFTIIHFIILIFQASIGNILDDPEATVKYKHPAIYSGQVEVAQQVSLLREPYNHAMHQDQMLL